jgi:hypothetical protein
MNVTVVLLLVSNFICVSSLVSECYKVNSLETFDRKAITKPICLSLISLSHFWYTLVCLYFVLLLLVFLRLVCSMNYD